MPDIHIERRHGLGLPRAREVARQWVLQLERDYGLRCSYDEGETADAVRFTGAGGVDGRVAVDAEHFEVDAELGFLFGSFGPLIEQKISRKLDELIGTA